MSVRRLIAEVDVEGLNVTEFCSLHGISRWSFYELRRRFEIEGEAGLEPRSRAPKTVANRVSAEVEDVIVAQRKRLEDQGLDAGPATIWCHLPAWLGPDVVVPSEATIWRVLKRRGFITAQPDKAPKGAARRFAAERGNECWQIDDTSWQLADGTDVKIINIIDDHSRLLAASTAAQTTNTGTAFSAFCDGADRWGWPARFLSDNAPEFKYGLADALGPLGIAAGHSRPYHPQTCGKVERFHQTLQQWLRAQPPAETLTELQALLDRFSIIYNQQRPHRSLGRQTPQSVWEASPKTGPANQPLGRPSVIHHGLTVGGNGVVHAGRRLAISLGVRHASNKVTVIVTGSACHVFSHGKLIRQLTIDHSRRNQPLHDRPGRPNT